MYFPLNMVIFHCAPQNRPSQKETIVFQPSIFRFHDTHVRKQTRYPPGIPSRFYQGSAHLADNLMLVSESIVQTWATALANVSLADVELQDAEQEITSWMVDGELVRFSFK